jgi:tetratricopeptide (TPR) repeat protein
VEPPESPESPESPEPTEPYHVLLSKGLVLLNQGDPNGAMPFFEKARSQNPEGVEALYYQGVIHQKQGRFQEAEADFRSALYRDRTFIPAGFDLAVLLYRQKKDKEAIEEFCQRVSQLPPG